MPDLTPEQRTQLDNNIKSMLSGGASQDDVMLYAKDFKAKYENVDSWRKSNPYSTGQFETTINQPASSTATNLSRTNEIAETNRTAPSKEDFAKENEGVRKQALATTAKRSKRTEAEVQKDVDEGKRILSSDGKGNKIYARIS